MRLPARRKLEHQDNYPWQGPLGLTIGHQETLEFALREWEKRMGIKRSWFDFRKIRFPKK